MADATATLTLSGFLLARIAEDEAAACAANGPHWGPGDGNVSEGGLYALDGAGSDGWSIAWFELGVANEAEDGGRQLPRWPKMRRRAHQNSVHAARHDPARVLAECEAKRRIVELADYWADSVDGVDGNEFLRIMLAPYADHPDYREEWRA